MSTFANGHNRDIVGTYLPKSFNMADNTLGEYLERAHGRIWRGLVNITADTETKIFNVFQVTGTVLILNQIAIITDATALTNCTNVFASFYDSTVSTNLTADGMTLSGVPVGSTFFKDKDETQTYTLLSSAAGEVYEPTTFKEGKPFYVVQKNGADSYIRFHVTTNTTLNFTMWLEFQFAEVNGSLLALAS